MAEQAQITRLLALEEQKLEHMRQQLAKLEAALAEKELSLSTLKAALHAFELRYMQTVGPALAELDQVRARIQEVLAQLSPQNVDFQEQAQRARQQADGSARATEEAQAVSKAPERFQPSGSLKSLFRQAAKKLHPDLAEDELDREQRTRWMAEVNAAYEAGDVDRLQQILADWKERPEAVQGNSLAAERERLAHRIVAIQKRIQAVMTEIEQLQRTQSYGLWKRAEEAEQAGRDLLEEMVQEIEQKLARERRRLERLTA